MTARPRDARRLRRAAAGLAVTVAGFGASAQSVGDANEPIGFPAGPFVIAPSLTAGYSYDSNVFLKSESASPPPSGDGVLTLQPALLLTLPFSNSRFVFGDVLKYVDYTDTPQTAGKTANDAVAELTLNFGSLDRLDLKAHHVTGVADTLEFDPGRGETFQGHAYRLHTESASISREVGGTRGYRCSLARNALTFDRASDVFFFDYRGFDAEAAYLQPLSPNTRIAFGYIGTRYDHFNISPGHDPTEVDRTESGNTAYAQIEGRLGPKQPYFVRLGWERLAFTGNAADDFSGLIGRAELSVIVGGGTVFTVSAERQPFRSLFNDDDPSTVDNNFYVFERILGRVERPFKRGSLVGGSLDYSRNTYGEPVGGITRVDRTVRMEAYANLAVREWVVFRLSFLKDRRYSTISGADYNDTVVFGGIVLGWS